MSNGFQTATQVVSAAGAQTPIPIISPSTLAYAGAGYLIPGIIVLVPAGVTTTYNVEVSGDIANAAGYVAANGIWVPINGMSGLTASYVDTLNAAVQFMRLNVLTLSGGSVSFQLTQVCGRGA